MSSFFNPIVFKIKDKPVIIYPCLGIEKVFDREKETCLEDHIKEIFYRNETLFKNEDQYYIVMMWEYKEQKMSDVWIFGRLESWNSGPLVDVKIFSKYKLENSIGVSAEDGLILLGREVEHRRNSKNLEEYINGKRADLPDDIKPMENFNI